MKNMKNQKNRSGDNELKSTRTKLSFHVASDLPIPKFFQRKIIRESKKLKHKKVFVATNLLESMIINNYPTRAEANDIYNCLELGASGLVLAAETAVGNYPENSILFLNKMIKEFYKKN